MRQTKTPTTWSYGCWFGKAAHRDRPSPQAHRRHAGGPFECTRDEATASAPAETAQPLPCLPCCRVTRPSLRVRESAPSQRKTSNLKQTRAILERAFCGLLAKRPREMSQPMPKVSRKKITYLGGRGLPIQLMPGVCGALEALLRARCFTASATNGLNFAHLVRRRAGKNEGIRAAD